MTIHVSGKAWNFIPQRNWLSRLWHGCFMETYQANSLQNDAEHFGNCGLAVLQHDIGEMALFWVW